MIHLIVGNTGSGKTTYANNLKKEIGGLVFSIDQWNNILFIPDKKEDDGLQWFLERIERSESLIMNLIKQLESEGIDSILDLGLSKIAHREKFRNFVITNSYEIKTHFLDISKETRLSRIFQRNKTKGDTFEFEVTQENFDFMENWFEKPTVSELKNGIIITK
ncbi:MAG: ATP-binding protein [Flavobacteriaceae bacterium]|nr:ATP-binding protein [Flavobacteriaceae bacterium]